MTNRIPGNRFGDRAARLAGVTLLAAAVGLAGAAPTPADAPVADRGAPGQAPAPQPDLPAASPADTGPADTVPDASTPVAAPIDFTKSGGVNGVPASVLSAYRRAAATLSVSQPRCGLPSELLAAIGRVESGHARGGRVDAAGTTIAPILGPVLSGQHGFAAIADTDGGGLDGDRVWDRAVGPMQFIPGTWARWAADGNGDGDTDPHNVFDASLAAGRYLCAGGRDLRVPADLDAAILSYNRSTSYLRLVLAWLRAYQMAVTGIPDGTGPLSVPTTVTPAVDVTAPPPSTGHPAPQPENPGTPGTPVPPTGTPTETPGTPPPGTPPPPPPTSTPPAPAAPGPVQSLVCLVGDVVTGLGSLLGAPPPADRCD